MFNTRFRGNRLDLLLALSLTIAACGDGGGRRTVGDSCGADDDCVSGLCFGAVCLDPEADDDGDGVINRVELALGTDPTVADTDGDGKSDRDELAADLSGVDSDADGIIDALESSILDADRDCLVDEADARNGIADGAASPQIPTLCPGTGVCAAPDASLAVMCLKGLTQPACDLRAVSGFETDEKTCDGLDNDCDGLTDEGCGLIFEGLLGHWRLDGDGQDSGPYRDHGEALAATWTTDRFGEAMAALRSGAGVTRVTIPATHHPLGAGDTTYTAWLRPDEGLEEIAGAFAFGELGAGRRAGLALRPRSDFLGCARLDTQDTLADSDLCVPSSTWSLVAVTRVGKTVTFFIDGRRVDTIDLAAAPDIRRTGLTIGATKHLASGLNFESFHGLIDDVRLYGRALSEAELGILFGEGGWQPRGSEQNPAQSCDHARFAGGMKGDGVAWLDPDGDGPDAAFKSLCDQITDGGGWTLAWRYGFTAPNAFEATANAVTPIPSWPASVVDVAVSTTGPSDATSTGAIEFSSWKRIGTEFRVDSPLVGGIACTPAGFEGGSIATGVEGPVECRFVGPALCDSALPDWVFFWDHGPGLSSSNLFVYFDGSTTANWPTHDPCGRNEAPTGATGLGGAVWLR